MMKIINPCRTSIILKCLKILVLLILFSPFFLPSVTSQTLVNADQMAYFHNGVLAIKKGNQWAFIDQEGNKIIDFRSDVESCRTPFETFKTEGPFTFYPVFSNDRSIISRKGSDGRKRYGFLDKSGNVVIDMQYDAVLPFKYNHTVVVKRNADGLQVLVIDIGGKTVGEISTSISSNSGESLVSGFRLEPKEILANFRIYSSGIERYHEGNNAYCYYLYSFDGKPRTNTCFAEIEDFHENMAVVRLFDKKGELGKWGFINPNGDFVIQANLTFEPGDFWKGLTVVKDTSKHYGYMNKDGEMVIPHKYEYAKPFYGEYAFVKLTDSDRKTQFGEGDYDKYSSFVLISKSGKVIKTFTLPPSSRLPIKVDKGYLYLRHRQTFWISDNGDEIIKWPFRKEPIIIENLPGPYYVSSFEDGSRKIQYFDERGQVKIEQRPTSE